MGIVTLNDLQKECNAPTLSHIISHLCEQQSRGLVHMQPCLFM
jgi:hypothetical protein